MHRVDTEGHVGGQWQDGNPQIGQQGTVMSAPWLNDIQENLCKVVEASGAALEKGNPNQLFWAIAQMINGQAVDWTSAINAAASAAVATARVRPGVVEWYAGDVAPTGYLECDGTAISRTTYADLFAVIGTRFGGGNGTTTFNKPDLRGEFIRGWDHGRGVDIDRAFASAQADAFKAHDHSIPSRNNANAGDNWVEDADNSAEVRNARTGTTGGTETRPRNIALLPIIKT